MRRNPDALAATANPRIVPDMTPAGEWLRRYSTTHLRVHEQGRGNPASSHVRRARRMHATHGAAPKPPA